jgi:hypothetical protein
MKARHATHTKKLFRRGPFLAEVTVDGNVYRFAIRDESHEKPTIHGAKKSLDETEAEVETVLDRLWPERPAA